MRWTGLQTNLRRAVDWFLRYRVFIAVTMLTVFGLGFVIGAWAEILEAFGLIVSISPVWILVLSLLQIGTLMIAGWTYQVVLRRQGYKFGLLRLIEIHLQRVVIGAVTPLGGPASIYVLVRALGTHRVTSGDALMVASIKGVTGSIAFLLFLVPALLLQPPTLLVTVATAGLFVALLIALWIFALVLRHGEAPDLVRRWAPAQVMAFIHEARAHRMGAIDLALPTLLSFVSHFLTAIMLYAGLEAVGYQAAMSTVLIGYVVGKLFFMMAPVFQGIGIVEIGMTLALQQAGVPGAVAVSGALLYRVGDVWLPLSWGFVVQLVRTPIKQRLREASTDAVSLITGLAGPWSRFSTRVIKLSRLALVVESPLALMIVVMLVVAAGLPSTG
ncbi:MAG: lysylphosphatidylglycerol synthase transmembrane domain-containing protein [Thermomicrobiaceae bacterium]